MGVGAGESVHAVETERVHLTAAVEDFLVFLAVERGYSTHTVRAYRTDLGQLAVFAADRFIDDTRDLTLELLREWLWVGTQAGLARATLARRSASARSFTAWLARTGGSTNDPGVRLRTPKPGRTLPRVINRGQMQLLLEALEVRASGGAAGAVRDLAVVEMLYASGLRVSELVASTLPTWTWTASPCASPARAPKNASFHSGCRPTGRSWNTSGRRAHCCPPPRPASGRFCRKRRLRNRSLFLLGRGDSASVCAGSTGSSRRCSAKCQATVPPARTRCATPWPRTFSTVAPTFAPCRSCWAT